MVRFHEYSFPRISFQYTSCSFLYFEELAFIKYKYPKNSYVSGYLLFLLISCAFSRIKALLGCWHLIHLFNSSDFPYLIPIQKTPLKKKISS